MKIGGPSFPFKEIRQGPVERGDSGKAGDMPMRLLLGQGQIVRGQVLGFTPEGKLLLAVGGQTLEARSEVALKVGSSLWLEVKQEEPLWLGLADRKGAAQEFLRQYISDPSSMERGLRALLSLAVQSETGPILAGQDEFLRSVAQLMVGRDADPAQVVRLLSLLGSGEGSVSGQLPEKLQELLRDIALDPGRFPDKEGLAAMQKLAGLLDLQRELNALPPAANQSLFLLLPCFFAMGAGSGHWLLGLDRDEEGGGEQGCTLSFFLEMSRLGEMQIQAKVKGDSLRAEFVVGSTAVRDYLKPRLLELGESLSGLGYAPVSLFCREGEVSLLSALKKGIEDGVKLDGLRVVDLKA